MAGHESMSSESDTFAGLTNEALRAALVEARAALSDVREAVHAAARNRQLETQRARDGLVDFLHFDLHLPLSTIEVECRALREALPTVAPDAVREGIDVLHVQIQQLRAFLDSSLDTARGSNDWPF
jgi:K+-sensing histidine kinase KdpD